MKLTVEIKDNEFIYSYEIGTNKHQGSTPLSFENLVLFSDLVRVCGKANKYTEEQWEKEMLGKMYLEKQNK